MTAPDDRPVLRPRGGRPIPYALTDAGLAALEAWPANRVEHEPGVRRDGGRACDGRGCQCKAGGRRGGAS